MLQDIAINVEKIKKGKDYVYPCDSYGDGICSETAKYDLVY